MGFTDNPLPSNKNVCRRGLFSIKRYCNSGELLYGTVGDLVVQNNKKATFLTRCRQSHSIPRVELRPAQIVSAMSSLRRLELQNILFASQGFRGSLDEEDCALLGLTGGQKSINFCLSERERMTCTGHLKGPTRQHTDVGQWLTLFWDFEDLAKVMLESDVKSNARDLYS
jgi:hypothetical protein